MKVEDDPHLQQSLQKKRINNASTLSNRRQSQPDGVINPSSHVTMRKSKVRFLALAMASLLMFGNNYSFDNPQALQKPIMNDVGVSISQYNLLYSAFSFPNIFLTLAGGLIVDFLGIQLMICYLLGVRTGNLLFCVLVAVSQTVVAIGGSLKIFWVMLAGRAMFGVSSENLVIAQAAMISKWFKGKELSTVSGDGNDYNVIQAIGCIMTVPEISSAANSLLSPWIYEMSGSLTYPMFFSVGICIFSLLCAVVLVVIDKRADVELELIGQQDDEDEEESGGGGHGEKVSFNDIKQLSGTFWILLLVCMTALGVYIPFLDDANDFFQEKFKFSSVQAGRVLTIPYLVSAVTSPLIGPQVDKIGKRRLLIMVTTALFILSQFLFGFLSSGEEVESEEQEPLLSPNWMSLIPLCFLGLSFAFYSCVIIPSVQYVVDQRIMGTAFGLMGMLESVALAFFPIIAASIVESSETKEDGYSNVGYFFCGIGCLAFMLSSSLFFFDKKGSMVLDFINPEEPNEKERLLLKKYQSDSSSDDDDEDEESSSDDDDQSVQQQQSSQMGSYKQQQQQQQDDQQVTEPLLMK